MNVCFSKVSFYTCKGLKTKKLEISSVIMKIFAFLHCLILSRMQVDEGLPRLLMISVGSPHIYNISKRRNCDQSACTVPFSNFISHVG